MIDSHVAIKVKPLGIIYRYNGVDVQQTNKCIKLSNGTYIKKILKDKDIQIEYSQHAPLPMNEDSTYNRTIENAEPLDGKELTAVENKYGFTYRQAIGKLIYTIVTCRPDISFPLVKLSQSSATREHFEAVMNIYRYLYQTVEEGIYFWRSENRKYLPSGKLPTCKSSNNYEATDREINIPNNIRATVDSYFANDTVHRQFVTGISIKMGGGCIFYKTRFQPTVALSSTEAEFIAACDAAKVILYMRSILDDIGISQDSATTLFEDNQGALLMVNSGEPTKRTRHMDTKYFALQHLVELDL